MGGGLSTLGRRTGDSERKAEAEVALGKEKAGDEGGHVGGWGGNQHPQWSLGSTLRRHQVEGEENRLLLGPEVYIRDDTEQLILEWA